MWEWLLKTWLDIKKQRMFRKDDEYVRLSKFRIELLRYCVPWFVGMRLPSALEDGKGHQNSALQAEFKQFLAEHRRGNDLLLRPDEIMLSWPAWTGLYYVSAIYSMFSVGIDFAPGRFTYTPSSHIAILRDKLKTAPAQERKEILRPRWRHPISKLVGALGYIYRDDDKILEGKFLEWSQMNDASWKDYVENFANFANTTLFFNQTCNFMDGEDIELLPSEVDTISFQHTTHGSQWQATDPLVEGFAFCETVMEEFRDKPRRKKRHIDENSDVQDITGPNSKDKTPKYSRHRIKRLCGRFIQENSGHLLPSGA
jgi:hypothetical protein